MDKQNSPSKLWDFAGSRDLSVFVLLMSITYVLVLFIFGLLVETRWLNVIAGLLPYKALYALFFLNLILFEIRWIPAVLRRCKREVLPDAVTWLQAGRHRIEVEVSQFGIRALEQCLMRRGYNVPIAAGAISGAEMNDAGKPDAPCRILLYASRGRFSPMGNVLFHASFLLLLFGALAGVLYGFEGRAIVTEGYPFKGSRAEYRSIAAAPTAALPDVDFDLEKISASLWDGRMFFTRLEAQLVHRGGRDIARVSSAVRVGKAQVTLSGYGYAPMFVLRDATGEVVRRGHVNLNIFGRGSEDDFKVPGYPHRVVVSFYPDHAEADGKIISRSMNPVNPAYSLRIFRGRVPVYAGVVKPGEWADYDGMSISFPAFARFGEFRIVRHPGYPLIWTAFIMMGFGLIWKLLFYRKEVSLWQDGEGRTWLTGRADYCQKLHVDWLESLAGKFGGRAS